jgi:hypothetical protein
VRLTAAVHSPRAPVLLLALATAGGLAGCAGEPGGGLGIATTRPTGSATDEATTTTTPADATSRPATSGTHATTTTAPAGGQAGAPVGGPLTFRVMTIRLRPGWRATRDGADQVTVATGGACHRGPGGVDCPGFLLLGPSQIAIANGLGPYDPERVWHPGTGVEGCPADRDGLAEQTPRRPRTRGSARVGPRTAVYREWTVPCLDAGTMKPKTGYRQRVWYLPSSGILVVDEWSTPGLERVLAAATFS